jgi:two-component system sensor histidine kinase FlrB
MLDPGLKKTQAELEFSNQISGRCIVSGNRDALQGAVMNIATNSLKHAGEGVSLVMELKQTSNKTLSLTISDNGPGIAPEIQDKVFDPFFTTSSSGTGLGLAVVQAVILDHNGRITLGAQEEGGASFRIELPMVPLPENSASESSNSERDSSLPIIRRAAV